MPDNNFSLHFCLQFESVNVHVAINSEIILVVTTCDILESLQKGLFDRKNPLISVKSLMLGLSQLQIQTDFLQCIVCFNQEFIVILCGQKTK